MQSFSAQLGATWFVCLHVSCERHMVAGANGMLSGVHAE